MPLLLQLAELLEQELLAVPELLVELVLLLLEQHLVVGHFLVQRVDVGLGLASALLLDLGAFLESLGCLELVAFAQVLLQLEFGQLFVEDWALVD